MGGHDAVLLGRDLLRCPLLCLDSPDPAKCRQALVGCFLPRIHDCAAHPYTLQWVEHIFWGPGWTFTAPAGGARLWGDMMQFPWAENCSDVPFYVGLP